MSERRSPPLRPTPSAAVHAAGVPSGAVVPSDAHTPAAALYGPQGAVWCPPCPSPRTAPQQRRTRVSGAAAATVPPLPTTLAGALYGATAAPWCPRAHTAPSSAVRPAAGPWCPSVPAPPRGPLPGRSPATRRGVGVGIAFHSRRPGCPDGTGPQALARGYRRGATPCYQIRPRGCRELARSRDSRSRESVSLEPHSAPRTTGHHRATSAPKVCWRKTPPPVPTGQAHSAGAIAPSRRHSPPDTGRTPTAERPAPPPREQGGPSRPNHRGPAGHASRPRAGPVRPTLAASAWASSRCRPDGAGAPVSWLPRALGDRRTRQIPRDTSHHDDASVHPHCWGVAKRGSDSQPDG